jgi:hypothetical protein
MIEQFVITGYSWIIGLSLAFALAFTFDLLTFKDLKGFMIFLTMFIAFVVWGDLLPDWVLVLCIIILTVILFVEIRMKGGASPE